MDEETLAEAIQGARKGDAAAFDRLVDAFAPRIFGFVFRLTGSRHDAEDLMQDVFIRVVRMIPAYQHQGRFEAWIFRIAANLVRDRVRRVRRRPTHISSSTITEAATDGYPAGPEAMAGTDKAIESRLVREEETNALNDALAKLPAAEREVIMLRHFSELSFKEIAEVMGSPLGTALARSHRGLKRLRVLMSEGAETEQPSHAAGNVEMDRPSRQKG